MRSRGRREGRGGRCEERKGPPSAVSHLRFFRASLRQTVGSQNNEPLRRSTKTASSRPFCEIEGATKTRTGRDTRGRRATTERYVHHLKQDLEEAARRLVAYNRGNGRGNSAGGGTTG
jgi:hypothetical protein